ncbi:MFS transporter [Bifidobacterium sp. W8106]|uniref:MFS transporter n=1 Tax=Bifidobacterium TaxID=1678 RepID=UPI0018DCFD54|nr:MULTISPECIES: MFS transporter [Bifidobacterium]MBI0142278.1 MFS transporter [Bifidobacterium choladohabitans]MBI0146704.1 MFS transporter [Bifidobacterium sp. W8104]
MSDSTTPASDDSELLQAHKAALAAAQSDPLLSPETGRPVPKKTLFRFGASFLAFGILWMSGLGIVSVVLLPEHFKLVPGIAPEALMGIVNACTAVASLVSNLLFGNFSDRSRSRYGRRTPWILGGAVLGGVTLFLTGMTTNPVLLTIVYCLCMFGLNCMIAPMVAILSDRVPSGVRGTLSAFYGAGSTIGSPIGSLIGAALVTHMFTGFVLAGVLMFLGGVVAVLIMPREGSAAYLPKDEGTLMDVLKSFRPPRFHGAHDFYKAFVGRLCMLLSYQMISAYQLYIIEKYVGQTVTQAAATISVMSVITMVVSLLGSLVSGPVSDLIGRRKVPVVIASVLFAIGIAMPWISPTVMGMYLYAGIAGFGYGVYSSVDQALNVDVLPSKEEAGKDLGILNLATTLGQMAGPLVMSFITLNWGYAAAFPTAIVFALLGCVFILMIRNVK